ncbi:MAG: glutamate synthase subunit beta [Myxococcaceae bacterium]|nr:glutamate synthase subunit beta [Myxococcaceae bacterium]
MGSPTAFLEVPRDGGHRRPVEERLNDLGEVVVPEGEAATAAQASRCMGCGVPFCTQGCPLGNPIPDFNAHIAAGRWKEAFLALSSTNPFPEFTGRICPAPCEAACTLAVNQDAVAIEHVEHELAEAAWAHGWVKPRPPKQRTGKTVAVVGSGPAGLAAAVQLNRAGHTVTVFERDEQPGGLLRYGIPDFKLDKRVITRRVEVLQAEGIGFRLGTAVTDFGRLKAEHDAVLLAVGARRPRELDVPGRELHGVVQAMDYLDRQNRAAPQVLTEAAGKRVVILGGGDTGSDCLGTALRQGAREVLQVELLPSPPTARAAGNPWPQWPLVFRVSSSQEEGGRREFARRTVRLEGRDGRLTGLVWGQTGPSLEVVPGTEQLEYADLLVLALGFVGPETEVLTAQLGLALDARGNVKVDPRTFATSAPGVFCAGDAMRGASLVVWALSDGREAARGVDAFLRGAPSALPTRGVDKPFGGR